MRPLSSGAWNRRRDDLFAYAAHEVELLATHEEFEAQYAAGRRIDCRGLRGID